MVRAIRHTGVALLAAACLAASSGTAEEPLDLSGTWFVLIHYTDPESAHPDAQRWKDLVWVFARKGSRLEWSEYSIVIFEDQTGRFESISGNPRSRVLEAWKPTLSQLEDLEKGPRVNPRGARIKTLSGSDARGWKSSRRRTQTSASVMGYHENLSIKDLDSLPVFERSDAVGNSRASKDGGTTLYEVSEIKLDGRRMVGRYERDGRQEGRFEMRRTAPIRGLEKREKTPNQRAAEEFMKGMETPPP